MNFFEELLLKIRYEFWPFLKVRLYYWYWIIKYGGKKNIPAAVIFGQMAKSLERMNKNLQLAMRAAPEDTSPEEMAEIREAILRAEEFTRNVEKLERNQK